MDAMHCGSLWEQPRNRGKEWDPKGWQWLLMEGLPAPRNIKGQILRSSAQRPRSW